jgi:NDP-sugar pyrophosphorylase family protein
MILHQVEALAAAGVTDIVLAVNYRPEVMEKHLAEVCRNHRFEYLCGAQTR